MRASFGINQLCVHLDLVAKIAGADRNAFEAAADKVFTHVGPPVTPRYPIYVISKSRWESRLTVKALEWIRVPYHVVIEPQEYEQYAAVVDPNEGE